MAEAPAAGGRRRIAGIVAAGVLLTAFFMLLRFPYDQFADVVAAKIEHETGLRVSVGRIGPQLLSLAPGLRASDLRITRADGTVFAFDRASVRPAWSLAWLKGNPALFVRLHSDAGEAAGTLTLAEPARWSGRIDSFNLSELPVAALGPGVSLSGSADAHVDITLGKDGPEGRIDLVAANGAIEHPALPVVLPFEQLDLDLRLGGENRAEILSLQMRSPLASGSMTGSLGKSPAFENAALRLEGSFTPSDEIRGPLAAQGVKIGEAGAVKFVVTGTPARPIVR
jgi:type II secretion system protein N